jgi:site-specific DNA recombinase
VKLMFQLAFGGPTGAESIGMKEIAKEFRRRNIRNRNGRYFSKQDIYKTLHNTAYVGRLYYNRNDSRMRKERPQEEWIPISVPPIIDQDLFDAVHAGMRERDPMRSNVRSTQNPTLLKNVVCGSCGGKMKGSSAKSGRYHYYQCKKAELLIDGGCAKPRRIGRELLDKLVVDHLAEVVFEPMRLRAVLSEGIEAERAAQDEAPRQLDSLRRRRAELDTRLSRLYTAIQLGKISFDDPVLEDQVAGLKGERGEVQMQIAALRAAEAVFPPLTIGKVREFSAALREALLIGEFRVRRAYLSFLLTRVTVYEHEIKLEGPKDLLAKAYGRSGSPAAIGAEGGTTAVLSQVDGWWSRGGSNP